MLRGLEISNLVIIDRLSLEFQPGLNVLTGETGAGKSILLDALGFVLGWRGRADLVRTGAEQGEVTAVFDLAPDHAARDVLREAGLPIGAELVLRRLNTRDGRKSAWVNDKRVSAEVLRALSEELLELHGQHSDRSLLDPRAHRDILDQFGGLISQRDEVARHWQALRRAETAAQTAESELQAIRAEEEFLRHAVSELDTLGPMAGEEAELDTRRRAMQAAERIREDVMRGQAAMGLDGAEGALVDAIRWLGGVAGKADGTLDAALETLERVQVDLGEAQDQVQTALEGMFFDPLDLEETEGRLFGIRGLARKHGVLPDDLPDLADSLRARLATLDAGTTGLADLKATERRARDLFEAAARDLTRARKQAAEKLDAAVMEELAPLKMERAEFATQLAGDRPGPHGADAVTFTAATNPGAPAGPIAKVASGGELSRFLLALRVCLADDTARRTIIFDEIDRGVGGATADAVGRRLARLAHGGQVLVVTHSPQVAALGAHHWRVEKTTDGATTTSRVVPLSAPERVDEIARMVAGDAVTDAARAAAEALLRAQAASKTPLVSD